MPKAPNHKKQVEKYIDDVLSGKIVACKWVKLACKRQVDDLKNLSKKGYHFDEAAANKILNFFSALKFTKGEKAANAENFIMEPFQKFRYWVLFGWKDKDGYRRFRKSYIEVARKQGKSEEAGGLCNYGLLADGEFGAEIYCAATKEKQAKIVLEVAKFMGRKLMRDSQKVNQLLGISKASMHVIETNSKVEAIASDSDKQDGLNPHFGIVDEYHAHKTSDVLEVLETAMGARNQPLLFVITTAGFNEQGPCFQLRRVACDILQGKKKDESFFAIIYTLDDEDDWHDEKNWIKSNPNIGDAPKWTYMRNQYTKAINEGYQKEVQFKTKNLNLWSSNSMGWVTDEEWQACNKGELEDLSGRECFGGLDLASVSDANAFTLLFPPDEEGELIKYLYFFWMPEVTVKKKSDIASYPEWVEDGYIVTTPGKIIAHRKIVDDINNLRKKYDIKAIGYDPYMAHHGVIQELDDDEIELIEIRQTYGNLSAPTMEMEKQVKGKRMNHGGNPVMRWMVGNIMIVMDYAENIKIDKKKSQEKVDGPVSQVMAIGAYLGDDGESGESYYDSDEFNIEDIIS